MSTLSRGGPRPATGAGSLAGTPSACPPCPGSPAERCRPKATGSP